MQGFIKFLIVLLTYYVVLCGGELSKYRFHPCPDNQDVQIIYKQGPSPGRQIEYDVTIAGKFNEDTWFILIFDTGAWVVLHEGVNAMVFRAKDDDTYFRVSFIGNQTNVYLTVRAAEIGTIPYLRSIQVNNLEQCYQPSTGFLDSIVYAPRTTTRVRIHKIQSSSCGRRIVNQKELIVNGASTKPGDWPWHVAIYRLDKSVVKYICGGTLISEKFVLTAAHCTTIQGAKVLPEMLSVVLGKYNLIGGDVTSQERLVYDIIVHDKFLKRNLDNDISLLKLKTVVVFDDYVQPACLWHDAVVRSLSSEIKGTVVGWGFDHTDTLSSQLMKTDMAILSEATCIRKHSVFYSKVLNENKFCAGTTSGTSPCNGDSGGGFVVFVPESPEYYSQESTGSWFIRGIVSATVSIPNRFVCDPEYHVVFTDVSKYKSWIEDSIKDEINFKLNENKK